MGMSNTNTQERKMTTTTPLGGRPNKFDGRCILCGGNVPAGTGALGGNKADGWKISHNFGDCNNAPASGSTSFVPTAEQLAVVALYRKGESMVIEACAGAGKTSTLILCAESDPARRVQYTAFNVKIVDEVGAKLPANASAKNVHKLAYAAVGARYAARIRQQGRTSSDRIAAILGINPIFVGDGDARRALNPGFLAGQVMKALNRFCQSADKAPTVQHFSAIDGVDTIRDDGTRSYDASNMIARTLLPHLEAAWADMLNVDGVLPFGHSYIKIWELNSPVINADVIMFDEAQDASPVLASIVAQQTHAQRVYVGDSAQAIYGFTGAIDAIAGMKAEGLAVATLSQSFRFGPAIAARANLFLDELQSDLRVIGTPTIASTLDILDDPDAILTRTNAAAIEALLAARAAGTAAHVVNIGKQVLAFARAARDLQTRGSTSYGDLAGFTSWAEVVAYTQDDALGEDLALLVRLVEKFTVETIIEAIEEMPAEKHAELTISTAHQSKGREWNTVRIASDFVPQAKPGDDPKPPSQDELRLRYVACTRAKLTLDCTALDDKKEEDAA